MTSSTEEEPRTPDLAELTAPRDPEDAPEDENSFEADLDAANGDPEVLQRAEEAASQIPDWVVMPEGLKIPKGAQVTFMRFRASWTKDRSLGDRQCILWPLSDTDEQLAIARTRGRSFRTLPEMSKQFIRAFDGVKADWTGRLGKGRVDRFWEEIGPKCRKLVESHFLKMHSLEAEEMADFFVNCVAVRSAVVGG